MLSILIDNGTTIYMLHTNYLDLLLYYSSRLVVLRHRNTFEFLQIDGCSSLSWVHEELRRRKFLQSRNGRLKQRENHMMIDNAIPKSDFMFIDLLKDCAKKKNLYKETRLHADILERGLLEKSPYIASILISMYTKCGEVAKAHQVLEELPIRNVFSWSALISGYVQQGQGHEALNCFELMKSEVSPDAVTFLCILNACSHSGLLDIAQTYFTNMSRKYRIALEVEHHMCMVVIYGCAGHFDKALSVIKTMPPSNDPSVWVALLGACKKWGNVMVGKRAFDMAVQLQAGSAAAYVLMASIYAASGMQEDAERLLSSEVCSVLEPCPSTF